MSFHAEMFLYNGIRVKYIYTAYVTNASYEKFCNLMANSTVFRNLAMYLYYAFEIRVEFLKVIV